MRKSFTAVLSALAVSTALLAGGSTAQAEPAPLTGGASASHSSGAVQPQPADEYEYYNWYLSQNNCLVAGGNLYKTDNRIRYRCDGHKGSFWYLYVNWP
ncbi:hypothetical protein [Streptomyces enissocaesilis]|uniref:Secreted protein n=1 Tax=Streptomyces enissocaesilis TaxID=332589 RepID=A0ABN3WN58_9ACTN